MNKPSQVPTADRLSVSELRSIVNQLEQTPGLTRQEHKLLAELRRTLIQRL